VLAEILLAWDDQWKFSINVKGGNSVAARVRKIDGADESNRNQD